MDHLVSELTDSVDHWDALGWERPDVALVSGSGLAVPIAGESLGRASIQSFLPFPSHGIVGHPMELELIRTEAGPRVVYFRGRLHAYQGYTPAQTVFLVRLAARLGAHTLLMTNASGAINAELSPGTLVLLRDQINLTGWNPLRGEPPAEWGPRFPDMTQAFDPQLAASFRRHARALEVDLREGVYAAVAGPSYETPAEIRMLRVIGADLVGMSTVLEVIAARHMGVRCGVVSVVSNMAAGMLDVPLDHEEVLEAGQMAAEALRRLLGRVIAEAGSAP